MPLMPPPPAPYGTYSLRFYQTGTATANFADNQWLFVLPYHLNIGKDSTGTAFSAGSVFSGINGDIASQAWSKNMRITATTQALEFSFDGTNVHGKVLAGGVGEYFDRFEGGIYVRGNGSSYTIEVW